MRCLNCRADGIAVTVTTCPKCGVYFPTLMRDILPNGTRLREGTYHLDYPLGQGGFGITYRGMHLGLDRPVAVKEFFPNGAALRNSSTGELVVAQPQAEAYQRNLDRFRREGKILAGIKHENVVGVLDSFEANGTAYLVMELVSGRTLKDELAAHPEKRLGTERVKQIGEALVSALERIHQAGVYHLDIKPDNVLVASDGRVVLADFGAAKQIIPGASLSSQQALTPEYAPPEVINRREVGPESDVFEMGMMAYELLTGKRPKPVLERMMDQEQVWEATGLGEPWKTLVESALPLRKEARVKSIREWWGQVNSKPKLHPSSANPKPVLMEVAPTPKLVSQHPALSAPSLKETEPAVQVNTNPPPLPIRIQSTSKLDFKGRKDVGLIYTLVLILVSVAIIWWVYKTNQQQFTQPDNSPTVTNPNPEIIIHPTSNQVLAPEVKITDIVFGKGMEAQNGKEVTVDYIGTLTNGTKFDSSLDSKQPLTFTLGTNGIIQGFNQGILGMKVGGKRKLVIPPDLLTRAVFPKANQLK